MNPPPPPSSSQPPARAWGVEADHGHTNHAPEGLACNIGGGVISPLALLAQSLARTSKTRAIPPSSSSSTSATPTHHSASSAHGANVSLVPLPSGGRLAPAPLPTTSTTSAPRQQHLEDDDDQPHPLVVLPRMLAAGTLQTRSQAIILALAVRARQWRQAASTAAGARGDWGRGSSSSSSNSTLSSSSTTSTTSKRTWVVFPRQREAFEFIDDRIRREVERLKSLANTASSSSISSSCTPTASPHDLKVFSIESGEGGKRKFIVASVAEFWRRYIATPPSARHLYELLREDTPVHLYFDVEFRRGGGSAGASAAPLNANVDGDALVACLLHRTACALRSQYGISISLSDVVHLESSTEKKFSRHLLIRTSHNEHGSDSSNTSHAMFRDALHAGEFVMQLAEGIYADAWGDGGVVDEQDGTGVGEGEGARSKSLLRSLWVETDKEQQASHNFPVGTDPMQQPVPASDANSDIDWSALTEECFERLEQGLPVLSPVPAPSPTPPPRHREFVADLGVYTRNRVMRMYMSTKYGKSAPLMPAAANRFGIGAGAVSIEGRVRGVNPAEEGNEAAAATASPAEDDSTTLSYWINGMRALSYQTDSSAAAVVDGSSQLSVPPSSSSTTSSSSSSSHPSVQIGNTAWEKAMWEASLINDALPPLWASRLLRDAMMGENEVRGGSNIDKVGAKRGRENESQVDTASHIDSSAIANLSSSSSASAYNPHRHPTHGFRLLYCWPSAHASGGAGGEDGSGAGKEGTSGPRLPRTIASRAGRFGRSVGHGVGFVADLSGESNSLSSLPNNDISKGGVSACAPLPSSSRTLLPPTRIIEGGSSPPPFPALAAWICRIANGTPAPSTEVPASSHLTGPSLLPPPPTAPPTLQLAPVSFSAGSSGHASATTIRSWSARVRDVIFRVPVDESVDAASSSSSTAASSPASPTPPSSTPTTQWKEVHVTVFASITYQIGGSRFCHRINRQHKGNHVYWVVDVEGSASAYQGCFDNECRGYRSHSVPVPEELIPHQAPAGGILVLPGNDGAASHT